MKNVLIKKIHPKKYETKHSKQNINIIKSAILIFLLNVTCKLINFSFDNLKLSFFLPFVIFTPLWIRTSFIICACVISVKEESTATELVCTVCWQYLFALLKVNQYISYLLVNSLFCASRTYMCTLKQCYCHFEFSRNHNISLMITSR